VHNILLRNIYTFQKTVTKCMYATHVLAILHLMVVTCNQNMQQTSYYCIHCCVSNEQSFWLYNNTTGWHLSKIKIFTCPQLIPSCPFLGNFKTKQLITIPPIIRQLMTSVWAMNSERINVTASLTQLAWHLLWPSLQRVGGSKFYFPSWWVTLH
jgi:hypothetical protein